MIQPLDTLFVIIIFIALEVIAVRLVFFTVQQILRYKNTPKTLEHVTQIRENSDNDILKTSEGDKRGHFLLIASADIYVYGRRWTFSVEILAADDG